MSRSFFLLCVLFATAALADTVHMKDGRKLEGVVTEKDDEVHIKTKFGVMKVKRADVQHIERLPREEYACRAAELKDSDAEGHFLLGTWCREQGLKEEAALEFEKVLKADPKHEGAHIALGHSRVGDRWGTPTGMLDSVDALLKLGKTDKARARLDPIVKNAMDSLDKPAQRRAWLLLSNLELRCKSKKAAVEALEKWSALASGPEKVTAKLRLDIVVNSVDGTIRVALEDLNHVQETGNLDRLVPGHQPLWDDRVLTIAFRKEAARDSEKARGLMAEAAGEQDRDKALRLYRTAEDFFSHSSEIVPNYGRPSQIECVRKMVPILFSLAEEQVVKANQNSPLKRSYPVKANNAGQPKFTPEALRDFEQTRRDWNAYIGKLQDHMDEINRLHNRFPDEFAVHKLVFEKLTKVIKEVVPEVRAYFDDCAKKYK